MCALDAVSSLVSADRLDLKAIRQELGLSQAQFARLVGFSVRAVQSCEQGWRKPGAALERAALLLLMAQRNPEGLSDLRCWEVMTCPPERRQECITYRTRQGHLCWFLNGTLCTNEKLQDWENKRPICQACPVFQMLMTSSRS
ncbi:MAG: helix-turn-helix domain-containing protein [Armatimonadota bacterium]